MERFVGFGPIFRIGSQCLEGDLRVCGPALGEAFTLLRSQ